MNPLRVLLVDDHEVVRQGLRSLLDSDPAYSVVGEAPDGLQACEMARTLVPDAVVMDASLPTLNGPEATRRVLEACPETKVIFLSMHDDAVTVDRALRSGARGYVLKGSGIGEIRKALTTVMAGEVYLSSGISDIVLQGYLGQGPAAQDPLTEREREVLKLIGEGYSGREIAELLGLKPKTVENYRTRLADKLDIRTTAGLVRYAIRTGLAE